jgi:hypothetical protein
MTLPFGSTFVEFTHEFNQEGLIQALMAIEAGWREFVTRFS